MTTTSGVDSSGSGGSESGSESGSGSSGQAVDMADIDMTVVLADTQQSIYTDNQTFGANSCAVQEGCVAAPGDRRLLRFDTITPNLGTADFYVGNPTNNPDAFEPGCQGGFVFQSYAGYRLLSADGSQVVSVGHKAAFALIDVTPWTPDAGPAQYGFGADMGISVGWADIYGAGLGCQYVDITGVPAGDYQLEISINADEIIEESTFDNNLLLVPVTITDQNAGGGGGGGGQAPAGWTCNAGYYDTNDGCDCGCGVFDPDCPAADSGVCDFCDNAGSCGNSCNDIDPADNATCL